MAQESYMSAPKAIIKVNGVSAGIIRNLRCTETKAYADVKGLGVLRKLKREIVGITCTWSCDFAMMDLLKTGIPNLDKRNVQSVSQYEDTLVLAPNTVDIYVYKKDNPTVTNGIVTAYDEKVFAVIKDVYIDSSNWDISENNISGLSQSGEYLQPIILAI